MKIPPEKIDEIRNATDIVELISSFTQLKKRGKNFVGLCPFHSEKTPSFTVSAERQMYHCFGCGAGGNVFTFIMEFEKISFGEAVKILAERAGIALPTYSKADEERVSENEQLYALCREAAIFYHKCLMETKEGKFAYEYFRNRGFTDEPIKTFGLGYSPSSWDALYTNGLEKKFDVFLMEKAGLIKKRDDGTYHDYFHGRAMFPIFTSTGRVVGFGARKLFEDDPLGKYINSPETPIFNKSRLLYGLYQAKDFIREKGNVLLVEGYADVISLNQSGFKNVVASSGTALTVDQIRLIARYTKKIILIYDSDSAGSKATLRGMDLILQNDCDVKIAVLAEGDDPDSSIRRIGSEGFNKLLDDSISFVDFIAQSFENEGKKKTPESQTEMVRAIVSTISNIKDEIKRNFYIRYVAEKYHLFESTLHRELEKLIQRKRYPLQNLEESVPYTDSERENPRTLDQNLPPVEKDLLNAMFLGGENVIRWVDKNLDKSLITNTKVKELIEMLIDRIEKGKNIEPASIIDSIENNNDKIFLTELIFSNYTLSKRWDERGIDIEKADPFVVVNDAVQLLKKKALEQKIEKNQQLLKDASERGENIIKYLEIHQSLINQLRELEKQQKKEG